MPDRWPRVARLDVAELIARVRASGGPELVPAELLAGGEVGAAVVALPSGDEVVLSAWPPGAARAAEIAELVSTLRARSYPAPEILQLVDCGSTVAVLQQLVDGVPPRRVDVTLVLALLDVHGLQRDAAPAPGGSLADLYLDRDGPGFCLHAPLADYSPETAALLDRIADIARRTPPGVGSGRDVVHGDFQPTNVLVDRGDRSRVAGVVDWTGARVGDADVDLVTLGFFLDRVGASPDCRALLRERLAAHAHPAALSGYAAHLALRQVDWVIRHYDAAEVHAWLAVATDWLDWAAALDGETRSDFGGTDQQPQV